MQNFFKNYSFYCYLKSTKFIIAISAVFSFGAININSTGNTEISTFIQNEGNAILQIPDSLTLNLNFETAKDNHSRAGILFFWGEREVEIKANYSVDFKAGTLKGSLQADTSWFTGYCGMIECQNKPMPAKQRLEVSKSLALRILKELNNRLKGAFAEQPESSSSTNNSVQDSTADTP